VEALKGVSLEIQEGDIVAVLGANGAGKTTLLKVISGLVPIKSGTVRLMGQDLSKYPPHQLASLGMAHIPEGRRVFATLTVEENLNIGTWGVRNKLSERQIQETKEWIFTLFPILKQRRKQLAGTLSGGEQQMLAIGRGLILPSPALGEGPGVRAFSPLPPGRGAGGEGCSPLPPWERGPGVRVRAPPLPPWERGRG
jgi:branched-chain amino acid transport system ATP-binding protein